MRCSHIVNNAHVQLAAVEYLNISGLVRDFATSPVGTGNSFFAAMLTYFINYHRQSLDVSRANPHRRGLAESTEGGQQQSINQYM